MSSMCVVKRRKRRDESLNFVQVCGVGYDVAVIPRMLAVLLRDSATSMGASSRRPRREPRSPSLLLTDPVLSRKVFAGL